MRFKENRDEHRCYIGYDLPHSEVYSFTEIYLCALSYSYSIQRNTVKLFRTRQQAVRLSLRSPQRQNRTRSGYHPPQRLHWAQLLKIVRTCQIERSSLKKYTLYILTRHFIRNTLLIPGFTSFCFELP